MTRPSRRFVWTMFALLLVAAALLGLWVRLQPAPARTPSPDVWTRGGTVGDLRDAPDGRPLQGWVFVGSGGRPPVNPSRMPFIVIVPQGRETPSTLESLRGRITGDPWRDVDARHLYSTGDVVTTPSGKWERYSADW